ncbi:lipase [Gordonia phage Ranch]|uniref:Esterase n=1 Tax=Gordonia phage Ranch TaxID=2599848 RepID=A0A5J6TPN5_9CAUD|nr:lipase [Gordonia phage Ranch]QFG12318.1 esterase [Gordonia phage Ranch]
MAYVPVGVDDNNLLPPAVRGKLLETTGASNLASFVTLGDSRTQFNGTVNQADTSGDSITKLDRGYMTWAMILLRQRMRWLKNGGVGGDTVAQMLARTDALLALNPGWLIGFGCINSINNDVTAATIITDLTSIFNKCAAAGVRVVWGTDWYSAGTSTTARKAEMDKVNQWLREQATTRRGFYLADYAARMVDPVTGQIQAALASDNLHQDGPGGFVMAQELVRVLEPLVPPSDRLIHSNADSTNLITNGMFDGDTSGRATGWASGSGGTVTYTKVARTDGYPGFWQQVAVVGATATRLRWDLPVAGGKWVGGDTVVGELEFETDPTDWNVTEFSLVVHCYNVPAGQVFRAVDCVHASGTPALTAAARPPKGIFRTPAITIHPDTTEVRLYVNCLGTGTYRVARARLRKV